MLVASALPIADVAWALVVVTARLAPTVLIALLLAGSFSLRRQLEALIQELPSGTQAYPLGGQGQGVTVRGGAGLGPGSTTLR